MFIVLEVHIPYVDVVVDGEGIPRIWKTEVAARRWAKKNCAWSFHIINVG